MSLIVNTNVGSLNAQRSLAASGAELKTAMERLSSGKKINSAQDSILFINREAKHLFLENHNWALTIFGKRPTTTVVSTKNRHEKDETDGPSAKGGFHI